MAIKNVQQLNVNSFPPGSPQPFKDYILRLGTFTQNTSNSTDEAMKVAVEQRERNDDQDAEIVSINNDIDLLNGRVAAVEGRVSALESWREYMTRQKSEVVYSGLSLVIPVTAVNFFTLISTLTPTSGNPLPFFQLTAGRLKALNKNLNLNVKFTIEGVFAGAVLNRSLAFTFGTAVPDTIYINRNTALASDSMNLNTFFSVEEGDDITNPGVTCMVQAVGGAFTASRIKIIATQ